MKITLTILFGTALLVGCQPTSEDVGNQNATDGVFEKNSNTVADYLESWQNESVDYDKFFAEDYESWGTGFGNTDTTNLAQKIEADKSLWEQMDFKILNSPINFLPGVNVDTKKMDGSVRHYSEWEISTAATDSTSSRAGNLRMYQAYVFNDEGKIQLVLTYGDFTGLMTYLNGIE